MSGAQFNQLNDTLSKLVSALAALTERVGALVDRVGALEDRVSKLEEKVDGLSEQFILLRQDVTESNAVIIKRLFEYEKRFEQVDDEFMVFKRRIDKRLETAHG